MKPVQQSSRALLMRMKIAEPWTWMRDNPSFACEYNKKQHLLARRRKICLQEEQKMINGLLQTRIVEWIEPNVDNPLLKIA